MSTSTRKEKDFEDPLAAKPGPPERVYYATGVMLDAEDFDAEQNYHRGRLARALSYLHGSGTVAGLEVICEPEVLPDPDPGTGKVPEQQLIVHPGLAIDRLGRTIEVQRSVCLRLGRWFDSQRPDEVNQALYGDPYHGVVADLFVRFVPCERAKTSAFREGPFDTIDAVVPERVRDGYHFSLILRQKKDNPTNPPEEEPKDIPLLPRREWPNLAAIGDHGERLKALHKAILAAWREGERGWTDDGPVPLREHIPDQDTTDLFLARVILPASDDPSGGRPVRTSEAKVVIDNYSRQFVYTAGVLARWLGL